MQKYDKRKVTSCLFIKRLLIRHASRDTFCPCLGDADRVCFANRSIPLQDKSPSISNRQNKKSKSIPLFLLKKKAQKKKLQKRKRRKKISRSAEHDHRCRWTTPPFEKGGRKLYFGATKIKLKTQSLLNTVKNSSKGEKINESYI